MAIQPPGGIALMATAVWIIYECNRLIRARNEVRNARSQIDVHLQRRANLIPNLVSVVRGYTGHEHATFVEVAKARASLTSGGPLPDKRRFDLESHLSSSLGNMLVAVVERYPALKADHVFRQLQDALSQAENLLGDARQCYNDANMRLHNMARSFPGILFAYMIGMRTLPPYFEVSADAAAAPPVRLES